MAKLIRLLQAEAAEVTVADEPFVADGAPYPRGTYVIRLSQPFGRWVKDILEPQRYPDIRWPYPNAPIDKPYDVTGWSLGMLMGVETIQIERPFEASTSALVADAQAPPGRVIGKSDTYVLSHGTNRSFTALNRLLSAGATVGWAHEELDLGTGDRYGPGAMLVSDVDRPSLEMLANELRLQFVAADLSSELSVLPIHAPRLAVYEPWNGNIDAGWTRWVLDQHEFSYTHVRSADLRVTDLYGRFDVIILPEMTSVALLQGLEGSNVRPEYRGGIGAQGVHNLRRFVDDGGTVITLGNTADLAVAHLSTPLTNVVRNAPEEAFYCPGSILRISIDTTHPIGYGMPPTADAMFVENGGFRQTRRGNAPTVRTIVRYPNAPLLRSGWIVGDEHLRGTGAVMESPSGKGRVILLTFRVQHRGQTWGTFKLLFNSIFYGPAMNGRPPVQTSLDAQ